MRAAGWICWLHPCSTLVCQVTRWAWLELTFSRWLEILASDAGLLAGPVRSGLHQFRPFRGSSSPYASGWRDVRTTWQQLANTAVFLCSLLGTGESYLEKAERLYSQMCLTREKTLMGDQEQLKMQVTELEEEVGTLRKINKSLFDFSSRIITKPGKQ
uniref:Uncharacterized protein n=1 Tax=Sphaerodactylus townsendi TaxID=933632 RepID=A0ACB8F0W8_9SAUR